ncbi:MAG: gephyrin-like molybdotransferase Glp [Tepidanaerobacteraceae bacterium]|jgi:molybdopterin molybdotransferase
MKKNVELEKAQEMLLRKVHTLPEENVNLLEAFGRVLSRDVFASLDGPPFSRSAVDGYTLTAEDRNKIRKGHCARLKVLEVVRAGYASKLTQIPGTTIKIMTGAPIPRGAQAVIKYEDVLEEGDSIIVGGKGNPPEKDNVVIAGEDFVKGECIGKKGDRLYSASIGLLAAAGQGKVPVYRTPRVALLSTGDEVVDVCSGSLASAQIYNSNLYVLAAYCRSAGLHPVLLGNVHDRKEGIAEKIRDGLEVADLVITTGGVSVGEYDLVQDALAIIGADMIFWKVHMKPGSPALAAEKEGKIIIGLSGNPAAASISFELLVRPVIRKLTGQKKYFSPVLKAVVADNYPKASPKRRFLRSELRFNRGQVEAVLTGSQETSALKSMLDCNALIDVPAGSGALTVGQKVLVHLVEQKGWLV